MIKTPQALIVEDDPDLAAIFTQALQAAGYAVDCLADGQTAQDYLNQHIPDFLLLDLHLPQMKGDVLLRHIRQDPRQSQLKIMIVTADTRLGDELRGKVDLVLQKPVSYLQLRDLSGRLTAVTNHRQNGQSAATQG